MRGPHRCVAQSTLPAGERSVKEWPVSAAPLEAEERMTTFRADLTKKKKYIRRKS